MTNATVQAAPAITTGAASPRSPAALLQPHPLTSVMQMAITFCSFCIAAAAITFATKSMSEERNARLVEIGVGILRVDPQKETQVAAARKWALDLIDANAGGVKFSLEARNQLLGEPLGYLDVGGYDTSFDTGGYDPNWHRRNAPPKEERAPPTVEKPQSK